MAERASAVFAAVTVDVVAPPRVKSFTIPFISMYMRLIVMALVGFSSELS